MAFNFFAPSRIMGQQKPLFDPGEGKISDSNLDLASKLSLLVRRGFNKRYVAVQTDLDAPMYEKHKQFLDAQIAKSTYDYYQKTLIIDIDRKKAFDDFNAMEYTSEISSALDIYADECLTKNEFGDIITIKTNNDRIKKVLENLFIDVLDMDHNLWYWIRQTCKYGNHFVLLDVQESKGIVGTMNLKSNEIRREEAFDGNVNSVKFVWDAQSMEFANWQIAHFKLAQDQRHLPYGTSVIESSRLIWKQLQLSEDAMVTYRITRAPDRRVFYIDVGNMDTKDVSQYMQLVKNAMKRTPAVQQTVGTVNYRYNPMAVDEDIFIPRRNSKNAEVDTLPGASNLDEIGDIEYLQSKLFASLKIPKAFLTFDEDINAKATLASEDFRFARTINRIQQSIISTLTQMAIIHLFSLGFRDKDQITGFEIELTNPSTQTEIEKLELWSQKANVFSSLWNPDSLSPVSFVWAMYHIFEFDEEQIRSIMKQQYLEGKIKVDIEDASINTNLLPGYAGYGGQEFQTGYTTPASYDDSAYQDNENPMDQESKIKLNDNVVDKRIQEMVSLLNAFQKEEIQKRKKGNLVENTLSSDNINKMLVEIDNYFKETPKKITLNN